MQVNRIIPFSLAPRVSEFDQALFEDIASSLDEKRCEIIPRENVMGYSHGTRWRARTTGNSEENEDGEMKVHSSEVSVPFQEIVDNNLDALAQYRRTIIDGVMQEFMNTLYQTISQSTDKTGNVVNANGGPFQAEQFIEMLEKIEFGVDRNGNVSFPEIHAAPELAQRMLQELSSQGPEFEQRVQEITKRKSEAALAREEDRKSRFPEIKAD